MKKSNKQYRTSQASLDMARRSNQTTIHDVVVCPYNEDCNMFMREDNCMGDGKGCRFYMGFQIREIKANRITSQSQLDDLREAGL